ncbi:chemerin-like receptor 1 [Latimeria chalumnae]|uniref:chemerin-like receptor 1 n=1 Tax=Latimeria chalumnae TaxID=7897 RepID=UPI0003C17B7F|nr:PREDICTED: chemokine-like receptor 1 [Latimeria chalumnae]|eukprot:XP_005995750.1 PREDICTED: chemokine-like receptor 1 [Latimeria chalumnae]
MASNNVIDPETDKALYIAGAVIYSLIFFLGILGNGLVIWTICCNMKKSISIIFFLNLAVADFLFAAFRPLAVTREAMESNWPFGAPLCKLNDFVKHINMYASLFMLTLISIDRCVMISYPVWARNHRTKKMAKLISLLVWFIAICFSLPYLILRDVRQVGNITECSYTFKNSSNYKKIKLKMDVTKLSMGFFIPFLIICTCYVIIVCKLRKRKLQKSRKSFTIIIAIIVLFFFCWLPYHLFILIKLTNVKMVVWKIGYRIAASLAYFNSCVNPILYFFVGYNSRQHFRQSFTLILKAALSDDTSLREDSVQKPRKESLPMGKRIR